MKCRSQPVVQSVQHTGRRPGGMMFVFPLLFGQNGGILDYGCNDSISAVSNCTMERLSSLIVLPVDHGLRLRPGKHFWEKNKDATNKDLGLISISRETRRGASSPELEAAQWRGVLPPTSIKPTSAPNFLVRIFTLSGRQVNMHHKLSAVTIPL